MPRALTLVVAIAALVAGGCGSDPQLPPDVGTPSPPGPFVPLSLADGAVELQVPSAWKTERGAEGDPLAAKLTSGRATIAVWWYPRTEPLPTTRADLEATRDSLVTAVKTRDPRFTVTSSRILQGTARRGVEVLGSGTNSGFERRARSLHLFGAGAEVVLDQYTTPDIFSTIDGDVFADVAQSLRVRGPSA